MRARQPPTMERGGKAGGAFFEADRCRGRPACRVDLYPPVAPRQKTPRPDAIKLYISPFRVFFGEKKENQPEMLCKRLKNGCFQSVFRQC